MFRRLPVDLFTPASAEGLHPHGAVLVLDLDRGAVEEEVVLGGRE